MIRKSLYRKDTFKVLAFNSGKCSIYTIEKRTVKDYLGTFDYHTETIGIQSFTEFQTLGIQIDKVIDIPVNNLVDVGRVLKIENEPNYYQIVMIQNKDTFPKSLKLTLTKTNIKWNEEVSND